MKTKNLKVYLLSALSLFLTISQALAQDVDISLQSGTYDKDPYPGYNAGGSVTGSYTIKAGKSVHTFTSGQFTINIGFPAGAVYAGGGTIPSEFTVTSGSDGSSAVVISITGSWSGTGPTSLRTFVLPIKIVAAAADQPTVTTLQWLDAFVTENSALNSTGSPLNVTNNNNPLPVTLTDFKATKEAQTSLLSWSTTEEFNSDRFDVEHSLNAKNWNLIGTVKSKGESKISEKYSLIHPEPVEGENLYRLKMVDQDGTFAYSRIVSVIFGEGAGAQIYPNPASDYLAIKSSDWKSVSKLKIISLNGQNVFESAGKTLTNQIDIRKIDPGVYLLEISRINGQKDLKKFVVVH